VLEMDDVANDGDAGWAWFTNLDDTNFVQLGLDVAAAFCPFADIYPGKTAGPFYVAASAVLYAKADTGAVRLESFVLAR
ncbi:MAG: hypothetical protein ABIH03_14400, partial [Pseudomonadota bacterium]